jgi:hypothetical protein
MDRRRKTPEDWIVWIWRFSILILLIHQPGLWGQAKILLGL